ncbi:mannitol-specific phosphotransferase enzyme IIA component [Tetragenococcus halophilus subsp. flandriensis]|uniref:PTS sugar transporter subunit IIA n=1 Tax=Tetragenococcus halophilus TaxID=51669 RepID=UPI0023E9711B|nr:PTS sugar transporter subunit IIA [Tetragenococcus halophilus]GMA08741.1 mannitol-specific phosphotransferase enzyme IIA component [Tetragenococcus halophilus subsp. flandriensis]
MEPIIDEKNIIINPNISNKEDAIKLVGNILVNNGYVEEEYIDLMFEREKSTSTYIGNNIAIPHGIESSKKIIKHSGISLIQLPNGIDYDGNTVHIVMGIAGKNNEHLNMLSQIAETFMDIDNVSAVKNAKTKREILNLLAVNMDEVNN